MSTARKRRANRLALLLNDPPRKLEIDEISRIHFTQTHIHSRFSNNSQNMDVFDTYFTLKFGLMPIEELPPIRVYEHYNKLWSIDNRRLWIMREAGKFYYEGPYTQRHSMSRFMEFADKYKSLHGTSGKQVEFHSGDSSACCIEAWNSGILDEHEFNYHLGLTHNEMKFFIQCPLWIMREAGKFYYEGPYTQRHSTSRFMEFADKYKSLHGTSGEQVEFHSGDSSACCIEAWNSGILDEHEFNYHLGLTHNEMKFFIQCPVHHHFSCECLDIMPDGTRTISLQEAFGKRCRLIRQLAKKNGLELSTRKKQLLNGFDAETEEEDSLDEPFARLLLYSPN
ncbi:unnamed protein product [Rotaria sp. Silwood1]|nr:unnamed protein product [Rotaria sp. Silwood1]